MITFCRIPRLTLEDAGDLTVVVVYEVVYVVVYEVLRYVVFIIFSQLMTLLLLTYIVARLSMTENAPPV